MPTANPVGSLHSTNTNDQALDYLIQRDLKVSLRPPETRYYYYAPTPYWSRCHAVQLLNESLHPVLNKLAVAGGSARSSDLPFAYYYYLLLLLLSLGSGRPHRGRIVMGRVRALN
jgi:hypothetical protein